MSELEVPGNVYSHTKSEWESIKTNLDKVTNDNTPFMLMPVRLETRFMKVYRREYLFYITKNVQSLSEQFHQYSDHINTVSANVLTSFNRAKKFTGEVSSFVDAQRQSIKEITQASSEEKALIVDDVKRMQQITEETLSGLTRNKQFSGEEVKVLEGNHALIQSKLEDFNKAFNEIRINKETPRLEKPIYSNYFSANTFANLAVAYKTVLKPELWVRVYPDDVFVHTHEEQLTPAEVEAGIEYWGLWWNSGGDTELQLAAWKAICEEYDPQRAAWIIRQTTPDNMPTPPSGASVVFATESLSAAVSLIQNYSNSSTLSSANFVATAQRMSSALADLRTALKEGTLTEDDQKSALEEVDVYKQVKESSSRHLDTLKNRRVDHPADRFTKESPMTALKALSTALVKVKDLEGRENPEEILSDIYKQNDTLDQFIQQIEKEAPINPEFIQEVSRSVGELKGHALDNKALFEGLENGRVVENKTLNILKEKYARYSGEFTEAQNRTIQNVNRLSSHLRTRRLDLQAIDFQLNQEQFSVAYETLLVEIDHLASDIGGHKITPGWNVFTVIKNNPSLSEPDLTSANNLTTKDASWTQAAKTHVLPDHFVAVGLNVNIGSSETGFKDEEYTFKQVEAGKLVPSTLQLGPDPSVFSDDLYEQLSNGDLQIEENLQWMVDFNKAVENGMGIIMPLEKEFSAGQTIFDKLVVLGLKLDRSRFHTPSTGGSSYLEIHSEKLLEELLDNHHYTNEGLEFIEAGTPTNNTSQSASGLKEDLLHYEDSLNYEVLGNALSYTTNSYRYKKDGQRLAEALGIDFGIFNKIKNADKKQISDGLRFNEVMWNATLGNFTQEMMSGLFSRDTVERLQLFFNEHVNARGILPSLRVGTQPYGILPTSSFTKWQHGFEDELETLLKPGGYQLFDNHVPGLGNYYTINEDAREKRFKYRYKALLDLLMQRWYNLQEDHVLYVGKTGTGNTSQQDFMTILGLQATAADIFIQYPHVSGYLPTELDSDGNLPSSFTPTPGYIHGFLGQMKQHIVGGLYPDHSLAFGNHSLAGGIGYYEDMELFTDPTVDRKKVSKLLNVNKSEINNYIKWFVDAPLSSIWDYGNLTPGQTSVPSPPKEPLPLLFKLLRQSYLMAHLDAFTDTTVKAGIIGDHNLYHRQNNSTLYEVPSSVQISYAYPSVFNTIKHENSKWVYLFENTNNLAASASPIMADFMTDLQAYVSVNGLNLDLSNATLGNQIKQFSSGFWQIGNGMTNRRKLIRLRSNLNSMRSWSTQKLDLHLREHLDLCSYRLDAWMYGMVNQRLFAQRNVSHNTRRKGIYLGAYGWLEDVKVGGERTQVSESNLPTEFQGLGGKIFIDDDNLGYVHTPSLNHALTAAILRSGYVSNQMSQGTSANINNQLAVNLSSERIRMALHLWEGVKNGQALSELLGYQFERNLLDRYNVEFHSEIHELRREYPLESLVDISNPDTPGTDETVNHIVVNGIDLLGALREETVVVNALQANPSASLFDILMVPANASLFTSVIGLSTMPNTTKKHAIAREIDLIANSIDALGDLAMAEGIFQVGKGNYERSNASMDALRETTNLQNPEFVNTPRTGTHVHHKLVVNTNTGTGLPTGWTTTTSIKATLAPIWNNWLAKYFPVGNDIRCRVKYTDASNAPQTVHVNANSLRLQPVDLYALLINGNDVLLNKVANYVRQTYNLSNETELELLLNTRDSGWDVHTVYTFGDMFTLVDSLQNITAKLRPVSKFDVMLSEDVTNSTTTGWNLVPISTRLTNARLVLSTLITDIGTEADIDGYSTTVLRTLLNRASEFNLPHAIPSSSYDSADADVLASDTVNLKDQLKAALSSLKKMKAEIDAIVSGAASGDQEQYDALTSAAQRLFGTGMNLLPTCDISLIPYGMSDYDTADEDPVYSNVLPNYLNLSSNPLLVNFEGEERSQWMFRLARVQKKIHDYENVQSIGKCFNTSIDTSSQNLDIMQFPHYNGDEWYGAEFGTSYTPTGDKSSVIFTEKTQLGNTIVGFILDEWTETIPDKEETSGITFNYDQPNSKPAQNLLLAVTPNETGSWDWDDLLFTLLDTLKMSKVRAVEPEHISQDQVVGRYVPTVISMKEAKYRKLYEFEHFQAHDLNVVIEY